ncbi:JAB domain-containing protein [Lactobacillus crispatus]|uniref:JAB domain-containing protein n=1 Tax=Lactobacillus crispatus TaxID=47770 RepID=UPI00105F2D5B|nr:JAB domain-containing protein [Lactobacillus crispatus]TDM82818.1 DNA repair protein RadC [Lactobacillus crispatus]TDM94122.1 DNA repair protein RadC [Lactobacillus crispatus]TDN28791.1 DNA repair protein RadC [Lactobacillus crispatus]
MTNEIKKIVKQEVSIAEMDRDQLLDYLKNQLQEKQVNTFDVLFAMLKEDLTSVVLGEKGMQAYLAILRKELASKAADLKSLSSSAEVGQYLADKYSGLKQEELHVICINNANKVVSDTMVSKGTIDKSIVDFRAVFRAAIENNASGFFLAHNHPSGKLTPSSADQDLVEKLHVVSKLMRIDFIDNFIVGNGRFLSFREEMLM